MFTQAAGVLAALCVRRGVLVAAEPPAKLLAPLESIRRVLFGSLKVEGQSLANLEMRKGGDASAHHAARRVIAISEQVKAVQPIIGAVRSERVRRGGSNGGEAVPATPAAAGAAPQHHIDMDWMREITGDGSLWVPRNTIVRDVFNEVLHSCDLALPVPSPDAPAPRPVAAPVKAAAAVSKATRPRAANENAGGVSNGAAPAEGVRKERRVFRLQMN